MKETPNGQNRRFIKGICPFCKRKTDWIRWDQIKSGLVISCGCQQVGYESAASKKIEELLIDAKIPYRKEVIFEDCRNPLTNRNLRYDFGIYKDKDLKELLYLIEYDGEQHFSKRYDYTDEEFLALQDRDKFKTDYCHKKGIPLIRIKYSDRNYRTLTLDDLSFDSPFFV